MSTSNHRQQIQNPFRQRLHATLKGQYRGPQVDDSNQQQIHAEEPGVSVQRDLKLGMSPKATTF